MKKKIIVLGLFFICLISKSEETKKIDKTIVKRKGIKSQSFLRKRIYKTKYFKIYYDDNSINSARKLINTADKIAETEVYFFRMDMPKNKIKVYLEDARDDTNAYSTGNGIHLYTNNSGVITSEIKDWIPYLFSHELTHELIDYKMANTGTNRYIPLSDRIVNRTTIPRWWTEGMAVLMESMISHGGGRTFDPEFMAIAIKDVNEDEFKGLGPTYINKPYEYGNSFLKFYLDTFGAIKSSEAIDYYANNKLTNIGEAYGKVVNLSSKELYTKWQYYLKNKIDESKILEGSIVLNDKSEFIQLLKDKGNTYILSRVKDQVKSKLIGIDIYKINLKKVIFDSRGNIRSTKEYDIDINRISGELAINNGELYLLELKKSSVKGSSENIAYKLNIKKNEKVYLPKIKRASNFVSSKGKVYYSFNENESQGISSLDNEIILPSGKYQITSLTPTQNGNILVTTHVEGMMGLRIYELDVKTKKMKFLVNGKDPYIEGNTLYYINNYGEEKNNVYKTKIGSSKSTKITNIRYDAKKPLIVDGKLFYVNLSKDGYRLMRVKKEEELNEAKSIGELKKEELKREKNNLELYGDYGKVYDGNPNDNLVTNEQLINNKNKEGIKDFLPQFTKPQLLIETGSLALVVPSSDNKDTLMIYGSKSNIYNYGGYKPVFSFDSDQKDKVKVEYKSLNSLYIHQFSEPTLSKTIVAWKHSENSAITKNNKKVEKKNIRRDDLLLQLPFRSDYLDLDFSLNTDYQGDLFGSDSHYQKLDTYFGIGSYQDGLFYDSFLKFGGVNRNNKFYKGNYGQDYYYIDSNLKLFLPFLEDLTFFDINGRFYNSPSKFSDDSLFNPNSIDNSNINPYTNLAINNTYFVSNIYGSFKHLLSIEKGTDFGKLYIKGILLRVGYSYVSYVDKNYKGSKTSTKVSGVALDPSLILMGNVFNDAGDFELGVGHVFVNDFTNHNSSTDGKTYAILSLFF